MSKIEGLGSSKESKEAKIKILQDLIIQKIERFMNPTVSARPSDEYFSGDGASYYTLVETEDGKVVPVKLGWGEMAKRTFVDPVETLPYPETNGSVREIPLPLYCLRQYDSYLADEKKLAEMEADPVGYFKNHALFLYEKGGIGFLGSEMADRGRMITVLNLDSLPVEKIDEAIEKLQNFSVS